MKRTWYKIMAGIIKKMFIAVLSSIVNASKHTKVSIFYLHFQ